VIVDGEGVARFVSESLGFALCPPSDAVGTVRDGKIINGILLSGFDHKDVRITVAGKGWTREFLTALGEYVFGQLGCIRATFVTEQPKVVEYAKRLGGEVEGVMRSHFGPGRDGVIIGVLAEHYRYVRVPRQ
jgi:hypothetical protein